MEQVMWHDIGIIIGTGIGIPDIIPGAEDMGICMGMAAFISGSWYQSGYITNGADSIAIPSVKLN
jgi:hypothetical protein